MAVDLTARGMAKKQKDAYAVYEADRTAAENARQQSENERVAAEATREVACNTAVSNANAAASLLTAQVNRLAFTLDEQDNGLNVIVYKEDE